MLKVIVVSHLVGRVLLRTLALFLLYGGFIAPSYATMLLYVLLAVAVWEVGDWLKG